MYLRYSSRKAKSGHGPARVVGVLAWLRHTHCTVATAPLDPCTRGTSAHRGNTRRTYDCHCRRRPWCQPGLGKALELQRRLVCACWKLQVQLADLTPGYGPVVRQLKSHGGCARLQRRVMPGGVAQACGGYDISGPRFKYTPCGFEYPGYLRVPSLTQTGAPSSTPKKSRSGIFQPRL